MAAAGQPDEQQIGGRRQQGAEEQRLHDAHARGEHAADRRTCDGHAHAVYLGHAGHLVLGVAHVDIEGVGHDAHHHIGNAVAADQRQQQHRLPAVAAHEVDEGRYHRAMHPGGQRQQRAVQTFARQPFAGAGFAPHSVLRHRHVRFAYQQRGQHADPHAGRHHQIGKAPRPVFVGGVGQVHRRGQPQHAGRGGDHGDAVAALVGGRHRALQPLFHRLDAVGVERDVLGGRGEGHRQRAPGHAFECLGRIGAGHADQRGRDRPLRQQQPGTSAAEQAGEQRQRQPVHQRRPHPFETVGQTYPAEIADGRAVHTGFAQPVGQRTQYQDERKAGRKAEEEHAGDARVRVHLEAGEPAGGSGHRSRAEVCLAREDTSRSRAAAARRRRIRRIPGRTAP